MSDNERKLDRMLEALPDQIEPARDLWPQIESQLRPASRPAWQWQIAASLLAVAVMVVATLQWPVEQGALVAQEYDDTMPMHDDQSTRYAGFESTFVVNHERSLERLSEQLAQLPDGTREIVIGNLRIIRASIEQINEAVEQEPNNIQLRRLLQSAYRAELDIISSVQESAGTLRNVRTDI